MFTVTLYEEEAGVYRTTVPLDQNGHYPWLIKATGYSFGGTPFTREELRSAATWLDPGITPTPDTSKEWCKLWLCLLDDERMGKALMERGFDVEGMRDCIARFCKR